MRFYESEEIGKQQEDSFQSYMQKRGWKVTEANFTQNVHEHWDFLIEKEGHSLTVDVKAAKKINRSDKSSQFGQIWVELKNVRGNIGWLYGKADFIAFQTQDGFSFIRRTTLKDIVESKITDKVVAKASDALYNRYTRNGRKDVITIVNYKDIKDSCKEI